MQILIERTPEVLDCTKLGYGRTLYVHLSNGEVIEVKPATAVRVTDDTVEALDGGTVVATFPRTAVYLAADMPMEPPPLD